MPTDKTTKEQQPKGRRKTRTSVKTNENGSESKDFLHASFVKPIGTIEHQTTTEEGKGQDGEDAVLCSQKIVPTFRKAKRTKPTERKTCQDKNDIPKKRLKTTGRCRNRSNSVVTTIPTHIQDQSPASDHSSKDDPINTGQSSKQQSDQSSTAQTCTPAVSQNVEAETITSNMETVTANDRGVQEEPVSDSPTTIQVTDLEQKLENNQIEHLTNKDISQVHANKAKDYSLYGVGDRQLCTKSGVSTEKINSTSGKQPECNKEPLKICHEITDKTVIEGIAQEQELCENIPNKKPGTWKTTEPDVQLIDVLKCKGVPNAVGIGDGHSKLMNKDEDIVKAGVPTLQVITATAMDKYRRKLGSSGIPTLHVINTGPKEQDKAKMICIPTPQGADKSTSCDLRTKACSAMDKQDISTTETNMGQSTVEAGMETNITSNLTIDRETKTDVTSNLTLDRGTETDVTSNLTLDRGTKTDVTSNLTLNRGTKTDDTSDLTLDRGTETDVTSNLTLDRATETDVTSNLTLDRGTKTDDTSGLTLDRGTETDVTSSLTLDRGTETDAASNLMLKTVIKTDVTSNLTSGSATVEEDVEPEEISDSQLYAITVMDWTEEPLGPAGDTGQSHQSKTKVLAPSIPDGTSIVKGLIRELSQLNMMLLRAKREMQTANQRMPPTRTSDNRVNTRTEK